MYFTKKIFFSTKNMISLLGKLKLSKSLVLYFLTMLCLLVSTHSYATPFTETVPGGNGPIPDTYPPVGGTMFVFVGANGNIYYQFVNPSTQFRGFQFTGTPTAFQGNPFQLGPSQDLNCGTVSCTDYFGGSIVEGYARLTARDADACPGNFDEDDVFFEVNGIRVGSFTGPLTERTNTTGTTSLGFENCFRNQASSETSTAWFDLAPVPGLLDDILTTGSTTPQVFDNDGSATRGDNFWFFTDGQDATGTPEVAPGISIVKTADVTEYNNVGDIINYTFEVSNIGSVTLEDIVVTDSFITGAVDCGGQETLPRPTGTPPVATSFECTASHTVTQANLDNDDVFVNTAEVTASPTEGTIGSVSGTLSIPGPNITPSLEIIKQASKTTNAVLNDLITYTYTVTNNGLITIDNVSVSDVHSGDGNLSTISNETITVNSNGLSNDSPTPNGIIDSLAPGDTATFEATYTINQNDINAGTDITNTATATGDPKRETLIDPTANATVELTPRTASMTLTKTPSISSDAKPGDVINYTYTVNNTGNTTITGLSVSDDHDGVGSLSAISCLNTVILPLSSTTCSASYTVLQGDIDNGTAITNEATASGSAPAGLSLADQTAPASVAIITPAPELSISKSANDTTDVVAGQTITYIYVVGNPGNVTINNVSIDDSSHSGSGILVGPNSEILANNSGNSINTTLNDGIINELAPGDSVTLSATYVVTQDDVDTGTNITNTAIANGDPQTGTLIAPDATEVVDLVDQTGSIVIQKVAGAPTTADGSDPLLSDPNGDTITYTITTINTGNVTLTDVSVTDTLLPITAADCAATSNADVFTNDGTESLDVGESVVCTVIYDLTVEDIDNGARPNTATANASDPNSNPVTDSTTVSSALQQETSISLLKTAAAPDLSNGNAGILDAGDTISYTFDVENTGNVTLTNVTVTDLSLIAPDYVFNIDCGTGNNIIPSLAAGATASCSATYIITASDINTPQAPVTIPSPGVIEINNQASVTGTPPASSGLAAPNALAAATATAELQAALAFEKSVSAIDDTNNDGFDSAGDQVTYNYIVTNTGATTLENVSVTEITFSGTGGTPSPTNETLVVGGTSVDTSPLNDGVWSALLAGDSITFSAVYTLTQADINTGNISNTASATGTPPIATGLGTPSAESSVIFPIMPEPSFTLEKSTPVTLNVGPGPITYTYVVENTGNVSINNITITDVHDGNGTAPVPSNSTITTNGNSLSADAVSDESIDVLAPGDVAEFTATYIITQEDIDIGNDINNDATANGTPEGTAALIPAEDSETVDLVNPNPLLSINKTANDITDVIAGQTITYTYVVTNEGNITMDNVSVSDSHSGTGTPPIPSNEALSNPDDPVTSINTIANDGNIDSLAPGDVATFTATYVITQIDVDLGNNVTNTATANGTPKAGTFTPPTNGESVDLVNQNPQMALNKVITNTVDNGDGITINLGDVLTYTVTATNTGNTTLNNVIVTDNRISPSSQSCASLPPVAPGGTLAAINTCVLIGTYTVTQDDVNAANINNVASVTTPNIASIPDVVIDTPVVSNPLLSIIKPAPENADEDSSGTISLDDTLTYTITATNDGTVILNNVVVTDSRISPNSEICPVLNLGETCVLTGTYIVQLGDVNAGEVNNTASVNSNETNPVNASNRSTIPRNPSIAVIKTASVAGGNTVGDVITYTFRVINTGDVTLNNVVINDTLTNSVNLAVTPSILAPGVEGTAQATYAIDQGDINTGSVTNTATAVGTPTGLPAVSDTSDDDSFNENEPTVTPLTQEPEIAIIKTASISGTGTGLVGEIITYTFTVSNEGNVPLTNILINDSRINAVNLPVPDIAVGGASQSITAQYTILQGDINDGSISNQAVVTADSLAGPATDNSDDDSILEDQPTITPLTQTPGIAIVKTVAVGGIGALNDTLTYTFVVTNTGNVPLTDVTIADSRIDISSLAVPDIPVGQSQTVQATYDISQSDIDDGNISNQATANGTAPDGNTVSDLSDNENINENRPTNVDLNQNPSIAIIKTASGLTDNNGDGVTGGVDDLIDYVFTVTNTGDVTLDSIAVNDPNVANISCLADTLAPGIMTICTGDSYTVTQTDIDAGFVTNQATVNANDPGDNLITDDSDDNTNTEDDPTITAVPQIGSVGLIKTAEVSGTGVLDDVITYTFEVQNTGTVTLTNPVVNDALTNSVNLAVTPTTLLPNQIGTAVATYTITQTDVDAGRVLNQASVTASDPNGSNLTDNSDNNSNSEDDPTIFPLNTNPSITLIKTSVVNGAGAVGDTITYTLTAENTGDVTLSNVVVNDALTGSVDVPVAPNTLGPGENGIATVIYTIKQEDLDSGQVSNSANVGGTPPPFPDGTPSSTVNDTSDENDPTEDQPTITPLSQSPAIAITKTTSGLIDNNGDGEIAGRDDEINYVFTVTNTGDVTIDNIAVTDANVTNITCLLDELAPGVITTCTGDAYIITQVDIDNGSVSNQATATANDPAGGEVSDLSDDNSNTEDEPTVTSVPQTGSIAIVKTGIPSGSGGVDDDIIYTFAVTNTGSVTLRDIVVNDLLTGTVNLPLTPNTLGPGEVGTATASYTIKQVDVDANQVLNQATVTGTGPIPNNEIVNDTSDGDSNTENDPTVIPLATNPSIALVKTSTIDGGSQVNDIVTYTFTVTNTGDMTLSNVLVSDPFLSTNNIAVVPSTLGPGEIGIAQTTYAIQQSDLNRGDIENTATVNAIAPNLADGSPRPPVTDTSDNGSITGDEPTVTDLIQSPEVSIVKTASVGGSGALNDIITYSFVVTNEGNIPLTGISVNDSRIGVSNLTVPDLDVGESATVTANYAIQQGDLNTGSINNQAIVNANSAAGAISDNSDDNAASENQPTITFLTQNPGITVLKTSQPLVDTNNDGIVGGVNDIITYSFLVRNTGNVTLSDIIINDDNAVMEGGPIVSLPPGSFDDATFSATHLITNDDISDRMVVNQATVEATLPNNSLITNTSDDPSVSNGANDPTVTTVPREITDIPTLSEWMLILLSLLLLSTGMWQTKQRKLRLEEFN